MLLALATLTVTAALPVPAEPNPLRPVEVVQIMTEGAAEPLCRGARLENGRIVAPLLPLVGVKAMKVRGPDKAETPVVSVSIPRSIPLLILDTREVEKPEANPSTGGNAPAPTAVGVSMQVLRDASEGPGPASVQVRFSGWSNEFRVYLTRERLDRSLVGAVVRHGDGPGALAFGPLLAAGGFNELAVLDADALTERRRLTPASWGEETASPRTAAVSRALGAGDLPALEALFSPADPDRRAPVHAAVLAAAVDALATAARFQTILDLFDCQDGLAGDERIRAARAASLINLERSEEALRQFEATPPASIVEEYVRACALEHQGKPEAPAIYRGILARRPDFAPAMHDLGRLSAALDDMPEASRCAMELLKLDPDGGYASQVAFAMESRKRPVPAEAIRREIVRLNPLAADARAELAENLSMQFRARDALQSIEACEALGISGRSLLVAGLHAAAGLKDEDLVRRRAELYLKAFPDSKAHLDCAGAWARSLDRPDAAEALLAPFAQSHPHDVKIIVLRAYLAGVQKRWDRSLELARQALELDPREPVASQYIMTSCYYLLKYDEAEAAAEGILKAAPKDIDALGMLVRCAAKRGDGDKYRAALDRLRALDPDAAHALAESVRKGD